MDLCDVCWDDGKFTCSECEKAVYCSEKCQKIGWEWHELWCFRKEEKKDPILWVRGTNTTIFLSCYRQNGRWYLMSKGDQFRQGFVPMSETIDPGITSIAGVNYNYISANPPSKFEESMAYALRAAPFHYLDTVSELTNAKYLELVKVIFLIMRLKQYDGEMTDIVKIVTEKLLSREWVKEELTEITETLIEFKKIKKLLFADIKKPSMDISREDYIAFQNEIRRTFGLEFWNYLSLDKKEWLQSMIRNAEGELYRFIASAYNRKEYLVTRIIMMKSFLQNEEYKEVFLHIAEIMKKYKRNIKVFMSLYEKTISSEPPVFSVTKNDEIILENPIPLIIASRNASTQGVRHREDNPNSEIMLSSPIEIGGSGANVIIVRKQDLSKFKVLLKLLEFPINDIEILTEFKLE